MSLGMIRWGEKKGVKVTEDRMEDSMSYTKGSMSYTKE